METNEHYPWLKTVGRVRRDTTKMNDKDERT